ncbi:hypothetical protein BDZ91DRAFT_844564 [Kalaharituber pfeilii]|nr:hypothetical protein BDZ91DRAFT_844564 [Kalaharituber pfeilii]
MSSPSVYFQGTLQEAIVLSIQRNLYFACLIIDDSAEATPENTLWEQEYMKNEEVAQILQGRTILYRISADGPEALNLYAFLPRPQSFPSLVAIKTGSAGQKVERIEAGEGGFEMLREWVKRVFIEEGAQEGGQEGGQEGTATQVASPVQTTSPAPATQAGPTVETPGVCEEGGSKHQQQQQQQQQHSAPQNSQDAQRSATPNIHEPESSGSSSPPTAKDKGKSKAKPEGSASAPKTAKEREQARREAHLAQQASRNSQLSYLEQQRKRQQDAEQERERVRKLLETDKAARAAREREEREARDRARNGGTVESTRTVEPGSKLRGMDSKECALSLRLLDGSAVKHKFPAEAKLGVEVRKWIDQNWPDEMNRPYTFTQLLTPFPNKHITLSEEQEDLRSLGLTPSATLVLTPTLTQHSNAYPTLPSAIPSPWSLVGAVTSGITSILGAGYNTVTGVIGSVTGAGSDVTPSHTQISTTTLHGQTPNSPSPRLRSGAGSGGARIRTLHDREEEDSRDTRTRFYNGNQLNFEPNQDDRNGR